MERAFHQYLKTRRQASGCTTVPLGDDAAVLRAFGDDEMVVTSDAIAEGTHFDLSRQALRQVGRKAMAVNLSDLAAMGAEPVAALLTLMLPRQLGLSEAIEIYQGCEQLGNEFRTEIVGGDTNVWSGPLVVSVTLIGRHRSELKPKRPWTLEGAKVGDRIVVSGAFGGSLSGHHLDFTPRVALAAYLMQHFTVHAATDASDSLSLDLWQLAQASEVGVEVNAERIPIAAAARVEMDPHSACDSEMPRWGAPIWRALTDGEDFELIMAVDPTEWHRMQSDSSCRDQLFPIGRFTAEKTFQLIDVDGSRHPFVARGYSH